MNSYSEYEIAVHEAGLRLQTSLPRGRGLEIGQLVKATGLSHGTVFNALEALEPKGKATSKKTARGNRKQGSIRLKGKIPVRKTA